MGCTGGMGKWGVGGGSKGEERERGERKNAVVVVISDGAYVGGDGPTQALGRMGRRHAEKLGGWNGCF